MSGVSPRRVERTRPRLVHLTTTDMSLAWLLAPQLVAFEAAGYEVIGVSAPGPFVDQLADLGVRHVPLARATRAMDPRADLAAARELLEVLRDLRPDILHTHNPKPGWYGRPLGRLAQVPIVVNTVHGLYAAPDDPLGKRAVVYALERFAAACSHAELVQNAEDVETLAHLGVPRQKMRLLGNGIDLTRFDPARFDASERAAIRAELGAPDEAVVVGTVGRLVQEKGIVEVLEAARRGHRRDGKLHWALVGPAEPDKADAVSVDALDRARADGVALLGQRDDVDRLYAGMDVFVLASHREGFPRAAMEAAAMGVPVIATDIRGCRQVVDDGVTGRLVPPRDAAALADAVDELAGDAARREEMGRAARAKARREFDQQRVIDITLGLYAELIDRG
jgi:glycosyltransferase involved in cell wall biosynthesis